MVPIIELLHFLNMISLVSIMNFVILGAHKIKYYYFPGVITPANPKQ